MITDVLINNRFKCLFITTYNTKYSKCRKKMSYRNAFYIILVFSGPNAVSNIVPVVDSNNVTLEWPRPEGRVETYIVRWRESTVPTHVNKRNVSQNQNGTAPIRLLVTDLMPGEEYVFDIQAISNSLESDVTILKTRTSKIERH